jgi:hypothetical protein
MTSNRENSPSESFQPGLLHRLFVEAGSFEHIPQPARYTAGSIVAWKIDGNTYQVCQDEPEEDSHQQLLISRQEDSRTIERTVPRQEVRPVSEYLLKRAAFGFSGIVPKQTFPGDSPQ